MRKSRQRAISRGARYTAVVTVVLVLFAWVLGPGGGHSPLPGASLSSPLVTRGLNCSAAEYQKGHLLVVTTGCQALFSVNYAENNFTNWSATGQYNFSFDIPWIAEITPSGEIVRIASPLAPYAGTANVTVGPDEVNLSSVESMSVTSASGQWTPNDTWAGSGPQWNISNQSVGTTTVGVVFHLFNAAASASANATENASYSVKFDVGATGWPWASPTDLLGFGLETLGAEGAHFAFDRSTRTLAESWNDTGVTFASLVFGGLANVTYPSAPVAPATVLEQVGLFEAASPARESVALVTLTGVSGGYSSMSYDPWVVFAPGLTVPPPSSAPSSPPGWPTWAAVALGTLGAAAGLSLLAAVVLRAKLRHEGEELLEGMRNVISRGARPPDRQP
jgi:hypothetical protein